jgi:CheY-like chemotaxis protein
MAERGSGVSIALFVGPSSDEGREARQSASVRASHEAVFVADADEAVRVLGSGARPIRCVFVDADDPASASFVAWLRGESALFAVPVVGTVSRVADDVYNGAHALGADDVVLSTDLGGMTRRLANLIAFDPSVRPRVTEGSAIVAHSDTVRRRVIGRILRQAGFSLSFAENVDGLGRLLRAEPASLMVASEHLPPDGPLPLLRSLRAESIDVPAGVLAERAASSELRRAADAVSATAIGSDLAPPDHLLFLANELMRPGVKDLRASERILFGALCGFRRAGSMEPVFGLTVHF